MNENIVDNLRRTFKGRHGREARLTKSQIWACFNEGYFCTDAEETYMELMLEKESA